MSEAHSSKAGELNLQSRGWMTTALPLSHCQKNNHDYGNRKKMLITYNGGKKLNDNERSAVHHQRSPHTMVTMEPPISKSSACSLNWEELDLIQSPVLF